MLGSVLSERCDTRSLLELDPYLKPYESHIVSRYERLSNMVKLIQREMGGLDTFSKSYAIMGCHCEADGAFVCRQYIPTAKSVWMCGDFNGWSRTDHPLTQRAFGVWELRLAPTRESQCRVPHLSRLKLIIETSGGEIIHRLDPWATYVMSRGAQDNHIYSHCFWNPPSDLVYRRQHASPPRPASMRIYECHVGISSFEGKVNSYADFTDHVLPRIAKLGYNTIQLMAVMEHAYYASFGYQVTSFFAPSSRFGDPEQLKRLVDKAHALGLYVLIDLVHSHASNNVADGLNLFDGTDYYMFHAGERGRHALWDSRLFNYGDIETLRFLVANVRMWVDMFGVDGFRFDGITSMIYISHGLNCSYSGHYDQYFGPDVDVDALCYLALVNLMLRTCVSDETVTIAEDVSGMPTLCRPLAEGGIGFHYRLAMAIPDMWIKMLKEERDEDWNMGHIVHTLTNRRYGEPVVAYAESHDQALVGDKTIAFWLMDKEMYTGMALDPNHPLSAVVERGLALHKMIRFLVHTLGGEAYLNFMGNEFGHPEWLDFPREGNDNSFHYARRQFHLADDSTLCYKYLAAFDAALNKTEARCGWLRSQPAYVSCKHEDDKVIAFERGDSLFVFNFHVHKSYTDYAVGVGKAGAYVVRLDSDEAAFGGQGDRISHETRHRSFPTITADATGMERNGGRRPHVVRLYVPARTAQMLSLHPNT